jgi:ribosomal protein L22
MRTAVTVGKTHRGEWALMSGPEVPLVEQLQSFRKLIGQKTNPVFCQVRLQESDGAARVLKFGVQSPKSKVQSRKSEEEIANSQ